MSAIDPGVEEGIREGAEDIEWDHTDNELQQREDEDFVQPSRWWFASTACPLLAGTFGPMASGFNICALCTYWREILPNGFEAEAIQIPDPLWLLIINVLSLVSAVVANAFLLLNMARRVKFATAQPIIIAGFTLAGVLLLADIIALTSSSDYLIANPNFQPGPKHGLTSAFYFGVFAAAIYLAIAALMCITVWGAIKGHYEKQFQLTSSQRTLMLQTMAFMAYLLLGAVVYNAIEGWGFMNSVYWADVTLLTVGLGDFSPSTTVGRGLLFPFAIGGVLIVGLVVGSIRSLILERGKEKMSARIIEKRRKNAVRNVDARKETIKISMFASAEFSVDPSLSAAQRREEEFNVMRKVQRIAGEERKYFALSTSSIFVLILWFVGAAAFMQMEYVAQWTYFESLYFAFVSLMTIGYGDFSPNSNGGRAFFVLWSLLAVPSLTILISNMGDTIVKWVSDLTNFIARLTVLPGEGGLRASISKETKTFTQRVKDLFEDFPRQSIFRPAHLERVQRKKRISSSEYEKQMSDRLAKRLMHYLDKDDERQRPGNDMRGDDLEKDIEFYHYVLACECRLLHKELNAHTPKQFTWPEWEYFLKLMGNEENVEDFPGQQQPNIMVSDRMRIPAGFASETPTTTPANGRTQDDNEGSSSDELPGATSVDGNIDRRTSALEGLEARRREYKKGRPKNPDAEPSYLHNWSWLSNESPLMTNKSEATWILDKLSAALQRELNRRRKGYKKKPPICLDDARCAKSQAANNEEKGIEEDVVQP